MLIHSQVFKTPDLRMWNPWAKEQKMTKEPEISFGLASYMIRVKV